MRDIFDVLHDDHQRVAQILTQIETSAESESDERASLVEIVRDELEVHAQFEEAQVYPAIQKALGEEDELKHAVEEHAEAMQLLEALGHAIESGDEWQSLLQKLKTAIEHHVEEEESELFPQARKKLPAGHAEKLANAYRAVKEEVTA